MQLTIPLLIATVLTSACATESFNVCPSLFRYTDEFQAQTAAELEALPENSALVRMVGDYAKVRNEIRVCRGEKPT